MNISAEVRGAAETQRELERVATGLHGQAVMSRMRQATLLVSRDAKLLAPVDTGRLRASITPAIRLDGNDVIGVVGTNVEYAAAVEVGSKPHWPPRGALETWAKRHGMGVFLVQRAIARRGSKPRKYLQGAFEKNKAKIRALIGNAVSNVVNNKS